MNDLKLPGKPKEKDVKPTAFDWESARQRIDANSMSLSSEEITPEIMQQIWDRRAAQLAQTPVQEDEGDRVEMVLVRLGREAYGFDVQHVTNIRSADLMTHVPRLPEWVAGVTNLRGRILSVLDLKRYFNLPDAEAGKTRPADTTSLVVVETFDMELAILVDEVLSIEPLLASRIQETTDIIRGIRPEYVRGVAERRVEDTTASGDNLLVVLNLPTLLADPRLIINQEVI